MPTPPPTEPSAHSGRMTNFLGRYFGLPQAGTTLGRECVAGLTTFVTMSYIIVVNPAILKAAGIPVEPSMVATIVTAIFGTLLMGLYANRPFAIAPYMGENAFLAYTVVQALGYRWQQALAAVFIAGAIFLLLTLLKLRQRLVEAIPAGLRNSFAVGIGLFLTFIGLNQTGIVMLGSAGAPVRAGHLTAGPGAVGHCRLLADCRPDDPPFPRRHSHRHSCHHIPCFHHRHRSCSEKLG